MHLSTWTKKTPHETISIIFPKGFPKVSTINKIIPLQFSYELLRNTILGLAFLKDLQCLYLTVQRKCSQLQLSLNPAEPLQVTSLLCPGLPGHECSRNCFPSNYWKLSSRLIRKGFLEWTEMGSLLVGLLVTHQKRRPLGLSLLFYLQNERATTKV